MKWFKHDADAHDNQKLQMFMAENPRAPLEAYGFYWMILEIVAKQMDATDGCEVEYPTAFLARKMGVSVQKLRKFLQDLTRIRALDAQFTEKTCKVKVPKLLEKRDEHTRKLRSKSGASQAQDKEEDKEEDIDDTLISAGAGASENQPIADDKKRSVFASTSKRINEILMAYAGKPFDCSPLHAWLNAGADPELDIIPTIQRIADAGKSPPPTTLNYFEKPVMQALANRTRTAQIPEAERATHGKPKQRHSGFEQQDYSAGTDGFHVVD